MSATTTLRQRKDANTSETATRDGETTVGKVKKLIYHYSELPEWQKDNDKILNGYVRETQSMVKCLKSLTYFHNESVNIYTHLIPSATYLVLLMFFTDVILIPHFPTTTMSDYIMINFYLLGAFVCLMCSTCFHCLKQHSEAHSNIWSKVDYMGIIVQISCSTVSLLYYGYHDHLFYFKVFTIITVVLGSCCSAFVLNDRFNAKNWRICRAAFFVCFAFSGIVPVLAGIAKFGLAESLQRVQVKYVTLEALFYLSGALVYGFRIPETFAPGKFDFVGHSHQIFHVLVVAGSICHFRAVMGSYFFMHTGKLGSHLLTLG
ncbi:LAMI_0G01310g1_1 [Lachancea mirantina]|uniref:LAMI_0G01310g1_1 n=1 Tax=Lachancea mirantina TaxID=1230905 RepID=A0A1G4K7E6_9SACH|nr:LAMI_0G01310g1_1 [Lachancea mirantina]